MPLPEPIPTRSPAAAGHRTADVPGPRRDTPRSSPVTTGAPGRSAAHCWTGHEDMAMASHTCPGSQQRNKRIPRGDGVTIRTWVSSRTAAVHFSSCDARKTQPRTLGAPYGSVAIPDMGRGAIKRLSRGDCGYLERKNQWCDYHGDCNTTGLLLRVKACSNSSDHC